MEAKSKSFPDLCDAVGSTTACVCSDAPNAVVPPCTCKSSNYTVELNARTKVITPTDGLRTSYQYKVTATPAKIGAINDVQMVIPRPLTPGAPASALSPDIIPVVGSVTVQDYCEGDKNSGVNKGNCDGFIAHIKPTGTSGGTTLLNIVAGQRVADGMVTLNLVSGQGSSEICQARAGNGNILAMGIVGPGDVGDAFQPKFTAQDVEMSNNKCKARLVFDSRGNVIDVTDAQNVNGYVPDPLDPTQIDCQVFTVTGDILVNDRPLKNNTGPHGITFGTGTTTCYGPSIPSPAKCVCTKLPCP
jgi:hypothetical protein